MSLGAVATDTMIKTNSLQSALGPAGASENQNHPDWMRVRQVVANYGIGRSTVFSLLKEGKIKSVNLTKRGNIRGIRLISRISLDQYLESLATTSHEEVCS
jgi:hypothetical protein